MAVEADWRLAQGVVGSLGPARVHTLFAHTPEQGRRPENWVLSWLLQVVAGEHLTALGRTLENCLPVTYDP
jgi:hypothetical protein